MKEYPEYVKIAGTKYSIDTSYKKALRCFDVINDDGISDTERSLAVIYLLFGFTPQDNVDKFLDAATIYLGCGETQNEQSTRNKDMDFNHDWKYIVASFASDYHLDISKEDMHFWRFIDLIQGFTEHCVMSRIRELRNYDLGDVKDAKTREKIAIAQKSVRLPEKTDPKDQEMLDEFESLFQ